MPRLALVGPRLGLASSLALAAMIGCRAGGDLTVRPTPAPSMPGPLAGRGLDAVRANRACESCHPGEAAEWATSLHHRSNVEPTYVRSFAIEPLPFCSSCHAPEAPDPSVIEASVSDLGVGCVTCHGMENEVLASPASDDVARAPHPVLREPRFATSLACASCHEFAFPGASRQAPLMQSTLHERRASRDPERACASCHMAAEPGGRRDHRFTSSRDPSYVRSAVAITARRLDGRRVELTLSPRELGHAFPTGDLFRRLEIAVEATGADGMVLSDDVRYLTRHFDRHVPGFATSRRLLADDRVGLAGDAPTRLVLDAGPRAEGHPIAYRVAYQRVEAPRAVDERDARLDGEIVLAQGSLDP